MRADVPQRPDRNRGAGRIDGHAAAVGVGDGDHVIDLREIAADLASIRRTAYSTVGATHCTVVVMPRMFLVPTLPSALRKPSNV